ncbi:hypothetical protein SETIT_8G242900v2 [Setaria italica]|uniref:Uncharacterized protein n=1 Tax=Setaria italica TaxID=4555 RepID=A0A368SB52_SETIT|nr:hypothetical protein SETIT_8G242900v2 [Setaria italica]
MDGSAVRTAARSAVAGGVAAPDAKSTAPECSAVQKSPRFAIHLFSIWFPYFTYTSLVWIEYFHRDPFILQIPTKLDRDPNMGPCLVLVGTSGSFLSAAAAAPVRIVELGPDSSLGPCLLCEFGRCQITVATL